VKIHLQSNQRCPTAPNFQHSNRYNWAADLTSWLFECALQQEVRLIDID